MPPKEIQAREVDNPVFIPSNFRKPPKWSDFNFDEDRQSVIDVKKGPASTRNAILLAAQRFEYFLHIKKDFSIGEGLILFIYH